MARVQLPYNRNPGLGDPSHGATPRRGRPFLFQITSPGNSEPLLPVMLALHANPTSVDEHMQKSKSVVMTYGGWVEWVWPDELGSVSCEASTGAFISPDAGLTAGGDSLLSDVGALKPSTGRKGSIAWERQQDLLELFRNNGMVYNSLGQPVLRGRVVMMYDRGIFTGHFTTLSVNEDETKPFTFDLSWEFKVESTVYSMPQASSSPEAT